MSRLKLGIAAGTLGLGIATLAMVGTGAFASFTAQAGEVASVTGGTFHMRAIHPLTAGFDSSVGVTPGTATVATGTTNMVTFTQTNADPAAKYVYQFTAYDSGSLAGLVSTLHYAPTSSPNTLMDYARITVEQCVHNNGACQSVRTDLNKTTGWQVVSYAPTNSPNPPPSATFAATSAETLHFRYPGGDGLNGFLNPGDTLGGSGPGGLTTHKHGTGWITYRVIVTFQPNITNGAQGQQFSFSLTATGQNI